MKSNLQFDDTSLDGDDRLMDALLREHARGGSHADEGFLARLTSFLDEESDSPRIGISPAMVVKRPSHRLAWSLGLAATLTLAAGLIWKSQPSSSSSGSRVVQASCERSGIALLTDFPPELIEGTPKAMNVPNLINAPDQAPVFYVPQGTTLLSRGKKVTSSDDNPIIGSLDLITDGDKQAGEGYFVELLDGLQWVQIDLEKSAAIHAIWLWHYHSQRRAYHDVVVQISNDPEFKTGVTTVYNNDYDNSAKFGVGRDNPYVESRFGLLVDGKGAHGRYVRLYSNGNTSNEMNHYIEVEVYGIPSK